MMINNYTGEKRVTLAIREFFDTIDNIIKLLEIQADYKKSFTYTNETNNEVAANLKKHLKDHTITLNVIPYQSFLPWSKAIGYTNGGEDIFINVRRLPYLSYKELAGFIAHEFCHHPGGYQHGGNRLTRFNRARKEMSVPYAIGYLVSEERNYPFSN